MWEREGGRLKRFRDSPTCCMEERRGRSTFPFPWDFSRPRACRRWFGPYPPRFCPVVLFHRTKKTTLNISILSVFPTKEYIYIYIYKCLEREWTAGVKIKNSLRVRSTSLLLIEFIKKEEKNYRITLEKGERKKREKKKKQEKHNKLSHSLSRIINLFSKIEVNRHFLESSRNRDFFLVMLSIISIIFLFYINK